MKAHSGGGPVFDLGVHAIDLLYWLMGNRRVVAVSSMAVTKLGNRDEHLATSLADSGAFMGVLNARPFNYRDFDVEDMAAADCIACNHRDDRLRARAHFSLKIEDVEAMDAGKIGIACFAADFLVPS